MVMRTEKFNYKWEGEALGSTTETATGDPGEYAARRRALEVAQDPGGGSVILHEVASVCRPAVLTLEEYIAGMTAEEVQRRLGLRDIVKLSSNENPLGPSPRVLEAIAATLPKLATYPETSSSTSRTRSPRQTGWLPRTSASATGRRRSCSSSRRST